MARSGRQHSWKLFEYDGPTHRVWILGQRCHHGATGSLVAAVGCLGFLLERHAGRSMIALALTGTAMMAHDWKDHSIWFERGRGTQPLPLTAGAFRLRGR